MTRDDLGRIAYEAFREHANQTNLPGVYPPWEDLPEHCREANRRAAEATVDAAAEAGLVAKISRHPALNQLPTVGS